VTVSAVPAGAGRLQVTVSTRVAGTHLRALRFGNAVNAAIEVGGATQASNSTWSLPSPAPQVTFFVGRVTPGQAVTVPLVIVHDGGEWPTFVGGGAGAF
jgi:hypothetical protein